MLGRIDRPGRRLSDRLRRRGDRRTGGGRRRCGDRAARDAHALAVLFDLDFGQSGFVQKLGQLEDEGVVDQRCFRRFCHSLFRLYFSLAPIMPASPVIASA
jgi:hypothetical protein